ncbi:MAG: hypothetical protein HETSPECPRED_007364 [Heterodermia speciosa]|uniref:Ubiquitin carboxyl-terminal hydrolase n=1 Tax=Heterodermia speciosa TaxID=116794 RepID=A0A8H3FUN6_9LECA|nr:MAG: hypothetical protein HETSPECPRED_007364 [Heterodermia speciosa]
MPDKPLTVLTYAASASLAAVALIYFFNPNHLFDGEASTSSASTRKKGVVGLFNPANDCFINCILQSLAGLGELRLYLIREVRRRELCDPTIYTSIPTNDKDGKQVNASKLVSLQSGEVTQGLKSMIDRLNERPIHKKTISASNFVRVLEIAFGTRISKTQQDAQELLQVVAERLAEEYHAGKEARKRVLQDDEFVTVNGKIGTQEIENAMPELEKQDRDTMRIDGLTTDPDLDSIDEEVGFPLEGKTEAGIECSHCHFRPKPNTTSFVMLNLMVPHKSSTTLNDCFDAHFKTEYIDDYTCDQCRLQHALNVFGKELDRVRSEAEKIPIRAKILKVQMALHQDPEHPPKDVDLPDIKLAPKRRIARHVQITDFPRILVIHLSRSVFDPGSFSTKNMAKVSFPEKLPLGGLLNRRNYKLLGMVTHRGTHNSGHYEAFRRQHLYAPYSTPHKKRPSGPYSTGGSPDLSAASNPSPPTQSRDTDILIESTRTLKITENGALSSVSSDRLASSNSLPSSTRPSSSNSGMTVSPAPPESLAMDPLAKKKKLQTEPPSSDKTRIDNTKKRSSIDITRLRRKKKVSERWWRISDDKIKECSTSDVLAMQKDVYMLFYEMDRDE